MSLEQLGIAIAGASIPVAGAGIGYIISIKNTRKRDVKSILQEIEEIKDDFYDPIDTYTSTFKNKKIKYHTIIIPVISFTSTINSGHFSYFGNDTRHELRAFYAKINAHNQVFGKIMSTIDNLRTSGSMKKYQMIVGPMARSLTKIDYEIKSSIDPTIKMLKKEL